MTLPDWDDAFANSPYIANAASYPALWAAQAAAFRATAKGQFDTPYDTAPRTRFDLFMPQGDVTGLVVFVHGGYWKAFDRQDWSHLAAGAINRGWAVAMPGYSLAPAARLPDMAQQIASAIHAAAAQVSGPIHLAGHSAGGHLVTRMLSAPGILPVETFSRIRRVTSIAGLHDLRPLLHTEMNATLKLTDATAHSESPALHPRLRGPAVTAWVGAQERPEFLRQSRLLAEAWAGTEFVIDAGCHHFDVIEGLRYPDSPLTRAMLAAPPEQAVQDA
ncbi:MAG: alpha/beta hydrolase [Roseinatronobacter sp.]